MIAICKYAFEMIHKFLQEFLINRIITSQMVVLGEYDMDTDPDCNDDYCADAVQYIYVSDVFSEDFQRETFQNDIILIKLMEPAIFSGNNYMERSILKYISVLDLMNFQAYLALHL